MFGKSTTEERVLEEGEEPPEFFNYFNNLTNEKFKEHAEQYQKDIIVKKFTDFNGDKKISHNYANYSPFNSQFAKIQDNNSPLSEDQDEIYFGKTI